MARLARASWVAVYFFLPVFAAGQCRLPPPAEKAIQEMPNRVPKELLQRQLGTTYLDFGCLAEAKTAFEEASKEAKLLPNNQEGEKARVWATASLGLANGVIAVREGRIEEAKTILEPLSSESNPTAVGSRALLSLAALLIEFPDALMWAKIEPRLKLLDENRHFWIAKKLRVNYGLNAENLAQRIDGLVGELRQDLPIQRRLENQIILLELLLRAERVAEARILAADIEEDVGFSVIDVNLRAEYVSVCAAIAERTARDGNAKERARLQVYQTALGDMYAAK